MEDPRQRRQLQQQQSPLTPAEQELEEALAGLRPVQPAIQRDAIVMQAWRRRTQRQLAVWRSVAAVLLLALGASLMLRPATRTVEVVKLVPPPTPAVTVQPPVALAQAAPVRRQDNTYLLLRQQVLDYGIDALPIGGTPAAPAGWGSSPTAEDLLDHAQPHSRRSLTGGGRS